MFPHRSALEVSDDERRRAFEAGWQEGGANAVLTQFYDLAVDEAANSFAAEFIRDKIREIVTDPSTAGSYAPRSVSRSEPSGFASVRDITKLSTVRMSPWSIWWKRPFDTSRRPEWKRRRRTWLSVTSAT